MVTDQGYELSAASQSPQPFIEQHYPIRYWAQLWGFGEKTIREWFRDEYGPGIRRIPHTGRRKKRDYTTIVISATAAARVDAERTGDRRNHRGNREVM
jgi:hypothetical protein